MNAKVDAFIARETKWPEESKKLREICLASNLAEDLKWGKPCYNLDGINLLIIQPFKEYCALMFNKGVLLKDERGLLKQPGEHTQSARQLRFSSLREIEELESVIESYIRETIAAEKAGLKVEFKKSPEPIPAELQAKFDADPAFQAAFERLTPGRQRAYILNISSAKQSATRTARVEKYTPQILAGKGLDDK